MESYPFAVSLGQTVEDFNRPFVWILGQAPFHVTDATKLKIHVLLRFRSYADGADNYVPTFKENAQLHAVGNAAAAPQFLQAAPATEYGDATS